MDDCKSSSMLCDDSYSNTADWFHDEAAIPYQKRVRSPGKYTQLEREKFRRERNRMHAKRTRDRKKLFFEISEKVISKMEMEASYNKALTNMKKNYRQSYGIFEEAAKNIKNKFMSTIRENIKNKEPTVSSVVKRVYNFSDSK